MIAPNINFLKKILSILGFPQEISLLGCVKKVERGGDGYSLTPNLLSAQWRVKEDNQR